MSKIVLGLFLGFLIGVGCRYFDIPLPSPPKLVGVLVVLSMTLGYVGMDSLLIHKNYEMGSTLRPTTTTQYCAGPNGLPPSHEQTLALVQTAQNSGRDTVK